MSDQIIDSSELMQNLHSCFLIDKILNFIIIIIKLFKTIKHYKNYKTLYSFNFKCLKLYNYCCAVVFRKLRRRQIAEFPLGLARVDGSDQASKMRWALSKPFSILSPHAVAQ